jgi:hypothetical protein
MVMAVTVLMAVVLMAVLRMVVVGRMVVVAVWMLMIGRPGQNGLRYQRHPGSAVFARTSTGAAHVNAPPPR